MPPYVTGLNVTNYVNNFSVFSYVFILKCYSNLPAVTSQNIYRTNLLPLQSKKYPGPEIKGFSVLWMVTFGNLEKRPLDPCPKRSNQRIGT